MRGPARLIGRIAGAIAPLLVAATLGACAPELRPAGRPVAEPQLHDDAIIAPDGARLPLRVWEPEGEPRAIILALHGFNDYSTAFDLPARYWAEHGILTYAYDQRGFGATVTAGYWSGTSTMIADLNVAASLIRAKHKGTPLFLLGESMGGAVLAAAANPELPPTEGVILVAPAVRARATMNPFYETVLWLGSHIFPYLRLTAGQYARMPTDNIEVLRAMSEDPLVIKRTRVDAVWGLVDLMDHAFEKAPAIGAVPTLVVYGTSDEIVPREPVDAFVARLPSRVPVAVYDGGYHMLLRDLNAKAVLDDVLAFIADPDARLASHADGAGTALFNRLDGPGFD